MVVGNSSLQPQSGCRLRASKGQAHSSPLRMSHGGRIVPHRRTSVERAASSIQISSCRHADKLAAAAATAGGSSSPMSGPVSEEPLWQRSAVELPMRLIAGAATFVLAVAAIAHPADAGMMPPAGTLSSSAAAGAASEAASEASIASSSGQVPITSSVNAVLLTQQPPTEEATAVSLSPNPRRDIGKGIPGGENAPYQETLQRTEPTAFGGRRHVAPADVIGDVADAQITQQSAEAEASITSSPITSTEQGVDGQRVFFDVAVDGEGKGRIVVQLYNDVSVGAARFADLARGIQGVGFRRTKFDAINQDFIQDAGLRRLSFGSERETPIAGGDGIDQLEVEMESDSSRRHAGMGDVSIVVRTGKPQQTKEKLVAYRGKLVTVQENIGEQPNGTAFAITLRPAPALDATNLVVGKVVEGMDVVRALAELPTVQNNSDSGYIKTAKFIGDRRADVALRSFGRPFAKIVVSACGPVAT